MSLLVDAFTKLKLNKVLLGGGLLFLFFCLFSVGDLKQGKVDVRPTMTTGSYVALVVGLGLTVAGAVLEPLMGRIDSPAEKKSGRFTRARIDRPQFSKDFGESHIRFSISALCRIRVEGRYLLVQGGEDQEPVSACWRRIETALQLGRPPELAGCTR